MRRINLFRNPTSKSQLFLISSSATALVSSACTSSVASLCFAPSFSSMRAPPTSYARFESSESEKSTTLLEEMTSTVSTEAAASNAFQMRYMIYGKNGKVEERRKNIKPPSDTKVKRDHVLVRVHAAGLNPVDAKYVIGDKLPFDTSSFVKGYTIGFEFSGVVVAIDGNEQFYKVGDEVFGSMPPLHGTLSEYIMAPKNQINHKPNSLSFIEAAGLPLVGLTAYQALHPYVGVQQAEEEAEETEQQRHAEQQPKIKQKKSLLVIGGAGGTGHVAIQVAKCLGGYDPIVAVCSPRSFDFCKALGATHVVDYTNNEVGIVDQIQRALRAAGNGRNHDSTSDTPCGLDLPSMVDVVFDCVTSADERDTKPYNYPRLLKNMTTTRYIRLGGKTKDWFYAGCERFLGDNTIFGKEKLFWIKFPHSSQQLKQLQEWCDCDNTQNSVEDANKLTVHVSKVIQFNPDAVQHAMDDIMSRRVQGKLVVKIYEDDDGTNGADSG